jgi:hypothetical protein
MEEFMKKILFALGLLFSIESFAAKVSFTYFGNEAGRQSYYACSYVEDQAQIYLEQFGAQNISLSCSGGITPWSVMPVSLTAEFDLPVLTGKIEYLDISGDTWSPACGMNTRMIREFLKVMKNVEVLKRNDACAFSNSNFYYQFKINL